jgi:hypothetical protein
MRAGAHAAPAEPIRLTPEIALAAKAPAPAPELVLQRH